MGTPSATSSSRWRTWSTNAWSSRSKERRHTTSSFDLLTGKPNNNSSTATGGSAIGEFVDKLSKGRLGYVHLFDMDAPSLTNFYLNLDSEVRQKKGVVIDMRNNNGGFVDPYVIDVLARKPFVNMTPRGLPKGSERTLLGQRAFWKNARFWW